MKKLLLTLSITLISTLVISQNIGIGTNTPSSSAKLEVASTTSGFLPPRMTYAQRNAIQNLAQGLIVYCTNCGANGEMQYYDGVNWIGMAMGMANTIFNYGAWSDCSASNLQTRTHTSSVAGATPPADSISRSCNYVPPTVIFTYGPWTGDCAIDGVQRRSEVSTVPADSFGIANPPIDSIIRICPATAATFPGTYKITADTLYTKLSGATVYTKSDIYSDTSWNPAASLNDLYVFNPNGSFTYNEGGTSVPAGSGTNFLSYPYSNTLGGFATGWSLQSGFLVYAPEANFGAWGYFDQIIQSKFVLNYSFTISSTGNKYVQSTTYTKMP